MPPIAFRRKPRGEPQIKRYTIQSPAEADEPRSREELNALRALGSILNERAWWVKWTKQPQLQNEWLAELEAALVHANVAQVLAVWPREPAAFDGFAKLREAAALPNQPKKKAMIEELLQFVMFPTDAADAHFAEGVDHDEEGFDWDNGVEDTDEEEDGSDDGDDDVGEDDSEDETALDDDDNVVAFDVAVEQATKRHGFAGGAAASAVDGDATMDDENHGGGNDGEEDDLLNAHKSKNPFAQIAWFVNMSVLRGKLLAIAPADWTAAAIARPIEAASARDNGEVVARTCALILSVVRPRGQAMPCSRAVVEASVPEETRANVLKILQLHFKAIHATLRSTNDDITDVIDVIVKRLALPAKDEAMAPDAPLRTPGPVPHAWMSDNTVSAELKTKFCSEISVLESVPDVEKFYRPDSSGQVLDLVDPSLFCGVIGETPCLPQSAARKMYGSAAEHLRAIMFQPAKSTLSGPKKKNSAKFRWLPCEIDVDEADEGGNASIATYINNLHPEVFAALYSTLAAIYTRFVPLFETVLSSLDDQADTRSAKALYEQNNCTLPCVPCLVPPGLFETTDPQLSLKGSRCQVIIKITEIHLTPQTPAYPGGAWHIEGTDSERIIATGLFDFGSENITESRISFRTFVKPPEFEQDDSVDVGLAYGLQSDQPLVQNLGSVSALEDRCIVFPNIYQHKVEPFRLADPTKPGARKMLAFFLVDPTKTPIPSTAVVPPQQDEWIQRAREPQHKRMRVADAVERLSVDTSRGGISLQEAKVNRVKLLAERSPSSRGGDSDYTSSLCEH